MTLYFQSGPLVIRLRWNAPDMQWLGRVWEWFIHWNGWERGEGIRYEMKKTLTYWERKDGHQINWSFQSPWHKWESW